MIVRMGKTLLCVLCRSRPVDERWRPFCSERCRNEDLAKWASGQYSLASDPVPTAPDDVDTEPD
jgi:endogenous inhibitor of DNA gyrase (YacG/DUF329 family)